MSKPKPDYRQGDLWWVKLPPGNEGAELRDTHKCVILQTDIVNTHHRTTIVAPLVKGHKDHPYVVNVYPSEQNRLDQNRRVDLTQIRVVDYLRFASSTAEGFLEEKYFWALEEAMVSLFMGIFEPYDDDPSASSTPQ